MIGGVVNARLEATVRLSVIGPQGRQDIVAVIDTGFNGSITLPRAIVTALQLSVLAPRTITLADTTRRVCDYFSADVDWDGQNRSVRVLCVEGDPLVGTALLAGHSLSADFVDRGNVAIRRLP